MTLELDSAKKKEILKEKPLEKQIEDLIVEESPTEAAQPPSSSTNDGSRQNKTISVSSDLLISLVENTVGKIQVPVEILLTVGRMIELRRTCAYSLVEIGGVENITLLHEHESFLSILEKVFSILKGSFKADLKAKHNSTTNPSLDGAAKDAEKFIGESASKLENFNSYSLQHHLIPVLQLEKGSDKLRIRFIVFYFFKDVAAIQGWLQCTWRVLEEKPRDNVEASLATITAIEIIHRKEQVIVSEFPGFCNQQRPYESIARMLVSTEHLKKLEEPSKTSSLDEFEANIKRATFVLASTAQTFRKFVYLSVVPRLAIPKPIEVLTLRSGSTVPSGILEHKYMKINEDDDEILSKYIIEFDLYAHYQDDRLLNKGCSYFPAEDYLVKGLRAFRSNRIISVSLVFAARIFLDREDQYGHRLATGEEELQDIVKQIQASINLARWFRTESRVMVMKWHEEDYTEVMELEGKLELIQFHAFKIYKEKICGLRELLWGKRSKTWEEDRKLQGSLHDEKSLIESLGMMQQSPLRIIKDFQRQNMPRRNLSGTGIELKEDLKTLGLEHTPKPIRQDRKAHPLTRVVANSSEELLTSRNPVFCGIAALGLLCEKESIGLGLCRYHCVVIFFAQLYIEITQSISLPENTWP